MNERDKVCAPDYQPVQTNTMPARQKMAALVWRVVNVTLFKFSPFFCRGWRRFLLRFFGANIHPTASPNRLAMIDYPWNLKLGAYSSIGPHCWIYALDKITIGNKTCVGDSVKVLTGTHSITDPAFGLVTAAVQIGDACWVATSSVLLPGVVVGEGAVVGACAVVTKDVEPWTVVAGNPAKFIKKRVLREK